MNDTTLTHVSQSQINTARLCMRKWWFEKISGLPAPPFRYPGALTTGSAIHAIIEHVTLGVKIEKDYEQRLFQLCEPFLEEWLEHWSGTKLTKENVERYFKYDKLFSVPVKGYIDMIYWDVNEEKKTVIVDIYDHKTKGSFDWCLSSAALKRDIQAQLYCYVGYLIAREKWPEYDVLCCNFTHNYILTKHPAPPRYTTVSFRPEEFPAVHEKIEGTIRAMLAASKCEQSDEVLPSRSACGRYGGCPWQDVCNHGGLPVDTDRVAGSVITDERTEVTDMLEKLIGGGPNEEVAVEPDTSFTVCINCVPLNGVPYVTLEQLLSPHCREYEAKNKVGDYMAANFNEGPRMVVAGFVRDVLSGTTPRPEGIVVVDTMTPLGNLFVARLGDLTPDFVVRGIR